MSFTALERVVSASISDPSGQPEQQEARLSHIGKRVLVVESDGIILGLITYVLDRHGLEVVSVSNASEALAQIAAASFDAIVLEPAGSDLLESIHEIDPSLVERVVLVTTGRDGVSPRPVHAVLRKPFEVAELARIVGEAALRGNGA
jgi:DNA-binding response OmpR family regulator